VNPLVEVFVRLFDEGVDVWRPINAEHLDGDTYQIADQSQEPSAELWQFPPGQAVICRPLEFEGKTILVAVEATQARVTDSTPSIQLGFRYRAADFQPDELTKRLGVEPTSQFVAGDPITDDGRGRRRSSGWRLDLERETETVESMLADFRELVSIPPSVVRAASAELGLSPVVVCSVLRRESEGYPVLLFPPDFIEWVAELGATLDVDIWV
jgi:hypothetical protein